MKRIITYIAVAVALIATSCTRESLTEITPGKNKLTIQLISSELQTKVEKPGVDDPWKENTISHFDYFFFSDAEGTDLLYSGRIIGDTGSFDTDEDDDFEDLRNGAYVYVLANYPEELPSGLEELSDILELPLSTDFQAGYNGKSLSFVMDNYGGGSLTRIKASKPDEETEVEISLSRIAAKLTMTINVLKEITRTTGEGEEVTVLEKWTPVLDNEHFFAYFVNADKTNTVAGEPQSRTDEGSGGYFTYDTKHGYTAQDDVTYQGKPYYSFLTDPAYTYPQTWAAGANGEPYFKIQMGWNSTLTGMVPLYYKVAIPIAETDEDNNVVFTLNRNTWYHLTVYVTVLGGALNDYVLVDNTYCVADFEDWTSPDEDFSTQGSTASYFDVPTLSYDLYSVDNLNINFICNEGSTAVAQITSIEYYNYGEGTPATGTLVPRTPTGNAASTFSYTETTEGRPYSLEVVDTDEGKYVKFTHDITDLYVQRVIKVRIYKKTGDVIETNIYRDVTIVQHPAIELKKSTAGDVFVNGRFARVANAPQGTYAGSRTIDGSTYYYSNTEQGSSSSFYYIPSSTAGYGSIIDRIGSGGGGMSSNYFTTDISVTAFSATNNYYVANGSRVYYQIGDPRVKASEAYPSGWSLLNYQYQTGNNGTRAWTQPTDIMICSQAESDRNKIAPRFLVSSALNAMNSNDMVTFANAVKRAATYQEAGYPAGRWRLPTEAEVAFIVARQNDETIPILYRTDSEYWCGSGRLVNAGSSGANVTFTNPASSSTTQSCRFVYDLWYWGDRPLAKEDKTNPNATPLATNVYHPNQHEY